MTDDRIKEIARKHGVLSPPRMKLVDDGKALRFVADDSETVADEKLMNFARELLMLSSVGSR